MLFPGIELDRIAIFVDAGYLFAQGGAAISGSKAPRTSLVLDPQAAVAELRAVAGRHAPDCRLLRIYWYDGAIGGSRPTTDQAVLAGMDDVKLRLGFVNSHGQQKGVDSLIVTDLIELARLKSISDALLLSGDEDVRIGVQIAQNYGVRIHLLGIHPARGSQSQQLMHEADTTTEWRCDIVEKILAVREVDLVVHEASANVTFVGERNTKGDIAGATEGFVTVLERAEIEAARAYWASGNRGVPSDLDRRLLAACRQALGRQLDQSETKAMRSRFRSAVLELPGASNQISEGSD